MAIRAPDGANNIQLQGDKAVSVVSIGQQLLVLGHFEAVVDISEWRWVGTGLFLCCYIILQKSRDLIKILTSACMLQSYKFPEFQKFYGRRHLTLPVLVKLQITRVPEVSWLQIVILTCPIQSSQVLKVSSSQNCRFILMSCHY